MLLYFFFREKKRERDREELWKKLHELELNRTKSIQAANPTTNASGASTTAGGGGGNANSQQQNTNSQQSNSSSAANALGASGDNKSLNASSGASAQGGAAAGVNPFAKIKADKVEN